MTSRRNIIKALGAISATSIGTTSLAHDAEKSAYVLKNNIKHSACRWCYSSIPFEELCIEAKKIGMASIELTGPAEWPILKKHGLTCAIGWGDWPKGMGLPNFFNNPKNHDELVSFYEKLIPQAAEAGIKNIICFSGNRNGMTDTTGMINCAIAIRRLIPTCEKYDVMLTMELLSSKDSHPDYQCDTVEWGVGLCEMINSKYFKLLYDIFHMQSMHGDHIRNIRRYGKYISHYHTGGMPGRKEIDNTQEIYYPAVIKALVESGYKGFLGQEFVPTPKDKEGMIASLKRCVEICDV
jgi:hydroxypyruvate isomerase